MKININDIIPQNRKAFLFWIGIIILAFLFGMIVSGGNSENHSYENQVHN